jgi:hypothetical protein
MVGKNREVTPVRKDRVEFLGHFYFLEYHPFLSALEGFGSNGAWLLCAT